MPGDETELANVHSMFLEDVLPRCLRLYGAIGLHSSGVIAADDSLVALVAQSGCGKSTLAAALSPHFAEAWDDTLALRYVDGVCVGVPFQSPSRLWDDSVQALDAKGLLEKRISPRNGKNLVPLVGCDSPRPRLLSKIVFIDEEASEISFEPLSSRVGFEKLLAHVFRLDTLDREQMKSEMTLLSSIANAVPIARLRYPRDYAVLPKVVELVLNTVRSALSALPFTPSTTTRATRGVA